MAKLYYQGHGSYRVTTDDERVIYVDPYAGDGYDLPADLILVTHQHHDHNKVKLVTQKQGCRVITNVEALLGDKHNRFDIDGILVESVTAKNLLHNPKKCVGYLLTVDKPNRAGSIKIYCSGDTSKTKQMDTFAARKFDYALFPCDGRANMGLKEAADCARVVGAKHNIPIHLKPGSLFDRERAGKWNAPNKLVVEPGQEIILCSEND
ncbi:MBL fold metallo-hydrolase [Lachnospiraceae bacterium ZAX-1]